MPTSIINKLEGRLAYAVKISDKAEKDCVRADPVQLVSLASNAATARRVRIGWRERWSREQD